jgi:L-fucose isomerase-like protein
MRESSTVLQKLVIQPVFICMTHIDAFMGPCRYGKGEELTYEYDKREADKAFKFYKSDMDKFIDKKYVTVLEPRMIEWHEDFLVSNEGFDYITEKDSEVDCYHVSGTRPISYIATLIAKRTKKPLSFCPVSNDTYSKCGGLDATAHLRGLGYTDMYNALSYDELNKYYRLLKVRKALKNTKALYALIDHTLSFVCVSSHISLQDITDRFGMEILHYDALKMLEYMDNLNEEEIKEAESIAADLVKNANKIHMDKNNFVKDTKFYVATKKLMKAMECNAFTNPCFEMCATKEINKRHFTFCLTHSLNKDDGIPSSCASDVKTIVTQAILMNLTLKAPHMGNCMVNVKDRENNSMRILHDVACKQMKGFDSEPLPIDFVSFTMDDWGTTMRYDFAKDAGEKITLVTLSPRMDKMMIAKATITGCDDFTTRECKHAITFRVDNSTDFQDKQQDFGHHFAWVYGDYTDDLKALCKLYNIESIQA